MSATEMMKELSKLTPAERQLLLQRLQQLEAGEAERLNEETLTYGTVTLRDRGITEAQAADLRARLKTFAGDWDRPEASIYDEDPAR